MTHGKWYRLVAGAAEPRNGITVTRSAAYATAAGAVQQVFDTLTTNTVDLQTAASGTVSYDRAADTVGGLASGSTQRTVNGASKGTTITENGTTKTCTRTLPRGALTCS
jgi:hypothetical protein